MVRISPQDESKLKVRIAQILKKNRTNISDQYYDGYCSYISAIDRKKTDIKHLRNVCTPVRNRFALILNRFIGLLESDNEKYDLKDSEEDQEYALRFVVPGRHRELGSHDIIRMTEDFVEIVTKQVLDELNQQDYRVAKENIGNIMEKLIYIVFEDLWISSVVAFRFQQSMIQQLLHKLMTSQEEERQKLWEEIHDEFLQALAVIPLKLEIIERLCQKDVPAMKRELNLTKMIAKKTIREIREFGHGFILFWVERKSFLFNLKRFIKLFERRFRIPVVLDVCADVKNLTGFQSIILFRIIQEGLYNIGKHSSAHDAKVTINILHKEIVTVIEDNGIGLDIKDVPRKSPASRHFGLAFMKERTGILAGSLRIDSARGNGTRITIKVPLNRFSNG